MPLTFRPKKFPQNFQRGDKLQSAFILALGGWGKFFRLRGRKDRVEDRGSSGGDDPGSVQDPITCMVLFSTLFILMFANPNRLA